jgi:hypothetical protein
LFITQLAARAADWRSVVLVGRAMTMPEHCSDIHQSSNALLLPRQFFLMLFAHCAPVTLAIAPSQARPHTS